MVSNILSEVTSFTFLLLLLSIGSMFLQEVRIDAIASSDGVNKKHIHNNPVEAGLYQNQNTTFTVQQLIMRRGKGLLEVIVIE